ncbi:MAG: toxin [Pseudomonadota bacterium]
MQGCFIELPAFERTREQYLDDDAYASLQSLMLLAPEAGDLIEGSGGLRKLRFRDARRGKGKRGGLRVIYFYWGGHAEFWLFALYAKGEVDDLSPRQLAALREHLKSELKARNFN